MMQAFRRTLIRLTSALTALALLTALPMKAEARRRYPDVLGKWTGVVDDGSRIQNPVLRIRHQKGRSLRGKILVDFFGGNNPIPYKLRGRITRRGGVSLAGGRKSREFGREVLVSVNLQKDGTLQGSLFNFDVAYFVTFTRVE